MSSLRDIMDVDVEPLPQTLRKSTREHITPDDPNADQLTSPNKEQHREDHGKAAIKRRKSSRPGQASVSEESSTQGESSATVASMDPNSQYGAKSHRRTSATSSTRHSSRSSDVAEGSVKYTPVTGRVSRAKKGQPVHVCDICKPSKTFTRAEHLRRHQLSHTKPAFPCTFQDCERAFHRPDLLARHMNRHETQGEKPFKANKPRSRASSADSSSRTGTPMLKVDEPSNSANPSSELSNPRASSAPTATNQSANNPQFPSTNKDDPTRSNDQNYASFGNIGAQFGAIFPDPVPTPHADILSLPSPNGAYYSSEHQPLFQSHIPATYQFQFPPGGDGLPSQLQLHIPEQPYPGLYTQDNNSSPWYGSDSPYSTPSDVSRTGRSWRERSASVCTVPDVGYAPQQGPWSPPLRTSSASRHPIHRSPAFGGMPDVDDSGYLLAAPRVGYNEMPGSVRSVSRSSGPRISGQSVVYQPSKAVVPGEPINHPNRWRNGSFQGQLEEYLSAYWRFFDPLWPIIHRPTFNPDASPTLRLAMAAIGTQFFGRAGDRDLGSELHKDCKSMLGLSPAPDIHSIQAILLTEIFAKFRSQKVDTQPSKAFKALYDYLLEKVSDDDAGPFSWLDSDGLNALLSAGFPTEGENEPHTSPQTRVWHKWIAYEIRQRLRSVCFMFDVHQSLYHEQPLSRSDVNNSTTRIIFPCPNDFWVAEDADDWCTKIFAKGSIEDSFDDGEAERSNYKEHLLICSLLSILPHRDLSKIPNQVEDETGVIVTSFTNSIIAHGYLQFYHSPLRDILAITGDTWVFGRKVKTQADFEITKRRLYTWSTSLQAAKAIWHACHVLKLALTNCKAAASNSDSSSACAYWSVYTAALICWAFGHRKAICNVIEEKDTEANAIAYIDMITSSKWQDLLSMPSNRGELAVVQLVKQRLDLEAVGGKCGMLVDATAVLGRISEGRGGKWF